MAVPITFLINSPHESSDEEYNDSDLSFSSDDESMENEPSESQITNVGSHSPVSILEREVTETEPEDEFWVQYPYLKEAVKMIVSEGLFSANDVLERAKLIGDEKAKELNDAWKALRIKEEDLANQKIELIAMVINYRD